MRPNGFDALLFDILSFDKVYRTHKYKLSSFSKKGFIVNRFLVPFCKKMINDALDDGNY